MADDDSTESTTETPTETVEVTPAVSDVDAAVKAATRKANKEAETLRLRLKEFEDRDKTETQKITERAETAERRIAEIESRALRADVALAKGLTASQAKRLVGTTEDELLADADELLADIKAATPRRGAVDQGERATSKPGQLGKDDLKGMTPAQIVEAKKSGRLSSLMAGTDR